MAIREPHYSPEEATRRGELIYERSLRAQLEADNRGKYVAIDIDSGNWEVDVDENAASNRLAVRLPEAQIYVTRVGYGFVRRFGSGKIRPAT